MGESRRPGGSGWSFERALPKLLFPDTGEIPSGADVVWTQVDGGDDLPAYRDGLGSKSLGESIVMSPDAETSRIKALLGQGVMSVLFTEVFKCQKECVKTSIVS